MRGVTLEDLKPYRDTFIGCTLFIFVGWGAAGLAIFMWLFFLVPIWIWNLIGIARGKENAKNIFTKMAAWFVCITFVFVVLSIRLNKVQQEANNVVVQAMTYKKAHGVWLKDNNTHRFDGDRESHIVYMYSGDREYPSIFYASIWLPFDRYFYDFKNNRWERMPGG